MNHFTIDRDSVEMADLAHALRGRANAASGYHAQQTGGTYGAAAAAHRLALACGIATANRVHFSVAMEAAERIVEECIDNGENTTYQIEQVFCPGNPYDMPFTIEVTA